MKKRSKVKLNKKKYQDGGEKKKPPIIVDNPTDPRLQIYQDSLSAYNSSVKRLPLLEKAAYDKHGMDRWIMENTIKNINKTNPKYTPQFKNKGYNSLSFNITSNSTAGDTDTESVEYSYAKPVQPIVYQPEEKNKPTYEDSLFMYNQSRKINEAAKSLQTNWGEQPSDKVNPLMQGRYNNLLRSGNFNPISTKEYNYWNGTDEGAILNLGLQARPTGTPQRPKEQPINLPTRTGTLDSNTNNIVPQRLPDNTQNIKLPRHPKIFSRPRQSQEVGNEVDYFYGNTGKKVNLAEFQDGGEVDPEFLYKDRYNTPLNKLQQKRFNKWVEKENKSQGRDILMDLGAYDVQGFWKSRDYKKRDSDGHGTDTWKKPNHPTFSNQSKYSGIDGFYGGNWTSEGGFQPSKQTLQLYGKDYYSWMFGQEPNRPEYLDLSRFENGENAPTPFVYQDGGNINNTGYLKNSKTKNNKFNIIPSNHITTENMAFPILANGKVLQPNTGDYMFDTDYVYEEPLNKVDMAKNGIHINPKNRGKFNALKKKTGKSTEELTHSKNPLTRKRAIFAQNAAKWNKQDGGNINPMVGGDIMNQRFAVGFEGELTPAQKFLQSFPNIGNEEPEIFDQSVDNQYYTPKQIDLSNPQVTEFQLPDNTKAPKQNNFWKNTGQQLKNQFKDTVPQVNVFGNHYLAKASMYRNKAAKSFSNAFMPKAQNGFDMGNIANIASGIGNDILANINTVKGGLDIFGNIKQNQFVKQYEANQLRQSIYADAENMPPNFDPYGKNLSGSSPAYYLHGGNINDYKSNNGNVLTENKEVAQLPNGLIDTMYGDTHQAESGGIQMDLPNSTKIFSEKLKHPEEKKSFARLAKKFETKKDIEHLENPLSDKINIATANLNIAAKNELSDNLFNTQEKFKLKGTFGKAIKKEAMKEHGLHKMPDGSLMSNEDMEYAQNGRKIDNNPTLRGTKRGVVEDYPDLDAAYLDYKLKGYKGAKDVTQMRRWDYQRNPQNTLAYIRRSQPTNKHLKIWNDEYSKTEKIDLEKMTPEEVFAGYDDDLWDFRMNKPERGDSTLKFKAKQPLVGDKVSPLGVDKVTGEGVNNGLNNLGLNLYIPQTYARDPIRTKNLTPSYITPKYLDIQPQLNQVNRQQRAFTSNLGSRTGADVANLLQSDINAYAQNQNIYGNKYNFDRQADAQSQQFNAQAKMNVDTQNLGQFNRFQDLIQRREGALDTQKRTDQAAGLQNMYNVERFGNQQDIISRMFNPSRYSEEELLQFNPLAKESLRKNGGKINKLKLGKKKIKY